MKITKNSFHGMSEDVNVNVLYPNMQVDIFKNESHDNVSYLVSTVFNKELFCYFFTEHNIHNKNEKTIIDRLKTTVKESVLKSI